MKIIFGEFLCDSLVYILDIIFYALYYKMF